MTVAETLVGSAIAELAALFIKTAWEKSTQELAPHIRQQIFRASSQYIKNYARRHGRVKVLGMSKAVSLERIYTTVQLLDKQEILNFATVEALEKTYRRGPDRWFEDAKKKRQIGIDVANREQYLTVLGQPGVGKSTFLRKIGLEALKGRRGRYKHKCFPVFLELKRFDGSTLNIKEHIAKELEIYGFPNAETFTSKALQNGHLLVLLDGLDEVPTKSLTNVIREINDFFDKYFKNRFIASCRVAAYHNYFQNCTDVVVAAFNKKQIRQFINNWFQTEIDKLTGTADNCWELLQKPENAAALELARTPLLLTFLCLVYDRSQSLSDNRSRLYKKALDILLEEWASEKRLQHDMIYQGLHSELEKVLLSEFAYEKFTGDQLFFSKETIIEHIANFLKETLDAPESLNCKEVLNAIEIQQGILVERAEDIYSFSHLTIQEFLVARYLAKDSRKLNMLISSVRFLDSRWQEVFLLATGLQDSADNVLLEMQKSTQKHIKTEGLRRFIRIINQHANSTITGDGKPAAKRALCVAFFLRHEADSSYDAVDRAVLESFCEKAQTLSQLIDGSQSLKYISIRSFNPGVSISSEEISSLNKYLTSTIVMLRCKQAALRVSPKVWHQVERQILIAPAQRDFFPAFAPR
ncbi:signal transduction protein with nacht domain protein [Leptolyngbya sp. Heron Island J]|uniref:NACHT domain-containing protein n=1 Tax=Leptolyngbya sp. Heron Island J TaxID=1385935 RepID=UPI0003B9A593|nr:NACHT domain-containing protein [Leptolyngbya sp. Heron Island J]ESA33894.1 signal transduction protein with nacht domain protein [Leptolyngbya sp. Heron Island J]